MDRCSLPGFSAGVEFNSHDGKKSSTRAELLVRGSAPTLDRDGSGEQRIPCWDVLGSTSEMGSAAGHFGVKSGAFVCYCLLLSACGRCDQSPVRVCVSGGLLLFPHWLPHLTGWGGGACLCVGPLYTGEWLETNAAVMAGSSMLYAHRNINDTY